MNINIKVKMREFPPDMQDYEKVFTNESFLRRMHLDDMEAVSFESLNQYKVELGNFLKEESDKAWKALVGIAWFFSKFRSKTKSNIIQNRMRISLFCKSIIGYDHRFISSSFYYTKIMSYYEDLIPNFDQSDFLNNPEEFEFPYKNLNMDHLVVVYQMPERLDILRYADEHKMSYCVFMDFVINYIGKYNETEPKKVYELMRTLRYPAYVKNLNKKYDKSTRTSTI